MLVKLAFVMQRLKNIQKDFCHDQQRWGGDNFSILWGDIELMGVLQSPPPLGKTLVHVALVLNQINFLLSICFSHSGGSYKEDRV